MEEALGLLVVKPVAEKTPETAQTDKAVESEGEVSPYTHQGLELFHRRKRLLFTLYSDLLTPAVMEELAGQFHCTEDALYKDLERRAKWEPLIWENYEAREDGKAILRLLQFARETLLVLMRNPQIQDSARVGAAGRYTENIKADVELRQGLGLLPKVTVPPQVQVNNYVQQNTEIQETANLLAEYEHFFKEADEKANIPADHPAKQVDAARANSEAN